VKRILSILLFVPCLAFGAPSSVTLSLDSVNLIDLARVVYGDFLRSSYVFETEFVRSVEPISVNFVNLNAKQVEKMTAEIFVQHGFDVDKINGVLKIRKSSRDDNEMLVYRPVNRSSRYLSDLISKVAGEQPMGTRGIAATPSVEQASQGSAPGTAGAMIDKNSSDQIAYSCLLARCARLRSLLSQLDTPESQIVLRAAVYEVGTTQAQGSALQLAGTIFKGHVGLSARFNGCRGFYAFPDGCQF